MTKEERALKNLKQMCSDGRYLGSGSHVPLEVLEDFEVVIKALKQEPVLDKIRAEISKTWHTHPQSRYEEGLKDQALRDIKIIDRYKAESEGKK